MERETQETSIKAYLSIVSGLGKRQRLVYTTIQRYQPISNKAISSKLRIPINCITPRVKELRDMLLVEEDSQGYCEKTRRLEIKWRCTK